MYLVTKLKTMIDLNICSVDVTKDGELAGYCLVYRRKRDAIKAAGKTGEILKVAFVSAKGANHDDHD